MWDSFHLFCINEDYYKDKNLSLLEISWFLSPVSWFTSAFFQRWEKTAVPEVKDNATAMELAVNGKVCCDPWPWKLHGWVVVYIFCILTTQNFTEFHSIPDVFFAWQPTIWIYFYVQTSKIDSDSELIIYIFLPNEWAGQKTMWCLAGYAGFEKGPKGMKVVWSAGVSMYLGY